MAFKDIIELFPHDIFIPLPNIHALKEMQKRDLSKVTKPVYIALNTFDTLEFPYNKFSSQKKSLVTARNSPKQYKMTKKKWSVYYNEYVKRNELDFYHKKMERIKWSLFHYIENFYNPYHAVDTNLCLIKTMKDLLDYNKLEYYFIKPGEKLWYDHTDTEFMHTASEFVCDYIKNHELYYILKADNFIEHFDFRSKFPNEYELHKQTTGMII